MARAQMSKGLRTLSDQLDHETCSDLEEQKGDGARAELTGRMRR